jgi:hypothetical protein
MSENKKAAIIELATTPIITKAKEIIVFLANPSHLWKFVENRIIGIARGIISSDKVKANFLSTGKPELPKIIPII